MDLQLIVETLKEVFRIDPLIKGTRFKEKRFALEQVFHTSFRLFR